ncbi:hypothetical protein BG015_000936 [Linnemannia schmuckeri]|uniref:Uncharacterized protein n=1 Tax=Linnemannia schmuckeri TaxID=64567 RepID=A0A9P5RU03_9FUNG|nr:hypothetical protein BG015_000936 [Linnemannia schmuckeri]
MENLSRVTRDLTTVNLDHVRFQRQAQVHYEIMQSHEVVANTRKDTPLVSNEDRVSLSNSTHSTTTSTRRSTCSQPFPPVDPLDASYKAPVRPLDPSLYFADFVFTTPDPARAVSSSPEPDFLTPSNPKRARAQQPPLRPTRLATAIDANTFPLLPEQQSNTMDNRIAPTTPLKIIPPRSAAASVSRNMLALFTTPASTTKTISDGVSQYEQERAKIKEKTDSLVIKFKTLPAGTDGAGTKESLKNLTTAIKNDDIQMPPRLDGRTRRAITSTPEPGLDTMVESDHELEPNAERELEAEELGGQGGKYGRQTERWIVDAVVIPIPKWLRDHKRG